jgi:hypothetical protein
MTKTSPLVAAELSLDEQDELFELNASNLSGHNSGQPKSNSFFTSLIDSSANNSNKHQIIRQVQESMNNLKNELLNKNNQNCSHGGGSSSTSSSGSSPTSSREDFSSSSDKMIHKDSNNKKSDDRLRIEQEMILQLEREKIAQEKERLKQEAEQLRIEREMISVGGDAAGPAAIPSQKMLYSKIPVYQEPHYYTSTKPHAAISPPLPPHHQQRFSNNSQNRSGGGGGVVTSSDSNLRLSVPNLKTPNYPTTTYQPLPITKKQTSPQKTSPHNHHNHRERVISTSQNDLQKLYFKQNLHKTKQHQQQHPPPKNQSSNLQQLQQSQQQQPPISLNQKCACCSQILGQGSAMYIEKLNLAFHLKCFRCSVCSLPLSNGKEGTDVRVSGLNRLHCNNCFSNDLGKQLFINFNLIDDIKTCINHELMKTMQFSSSSTSSTATSINNNYNECKKELNKKKNKNYKLLVTDYDDYSILPNYFNLKNYTQNSQNNINEKKIKKK